MIRPKLYLLDGSADAFAVIAEYASCVTTLRYRSHSDINALVPESQYANVSAAEYVRTDDDDEVYLVERVAREYGSGVELNGRSVTALLHTRTILGTLSWNAAKGGAAVKTVLDSFTSTRALPITFGTGDTLGGTISMQRSWGDAGVAVGELLAASAMGMRGRIEGAGFKLDVFESANNGVRLGEAYGDGNTAKVERDKSGWRNFAYVLGQGEGPLRRQVTVDLTGGNPRRELYVDANDLSADGLTAAQYDAALTARGVAKLAETQVVEYADAEIGRALQPGETVFYDAGDFAGEFMVTETTTIREGDKTVHRSKLGFEADAFTIGVQNAASRAVESGGAWLTSGITAESGWSIVASQRIRRVGDVVSFRISVERTGGAITVPADGNITDQHVATMPEAFRPTEAQALSAYITGPVQSWFISNLGAINLAALAPGSTITTGTRLSVGGVYLLG